jgi:hypothetical protein
MHVSKQEYLSKCAMIMYSAQPDQVCDRDRTVYMYTNTSMRMDMKIHADDMTSLIARCASNCLRERSLRAQETLFVCIEYRHQRDLGV